MKFSVKSLLLQFTIIICAVFVLQNCGSNNSTSGPNFNTVPPPYDLSKADTTFAKEGGVKIYVIEKGYGPFKVIPRDQISLKFTGRTMNGKIFLSTFSDSSTTPGRILNLNTTAKTVNGRTIQPQIEGLRRGLLGMIEGEKRTIIVPPSLGFNDSNPGANGFDLRGDSLRYDVELVSIF